jgi:hypothetical protein
MRLVKQRLNFAERCRRNSGRIRLSAYIFAAFAGASTRGTLGQVEVVILEVFE